MYCHVVTQIWFKKKAVQKKNDEKHRNREYEIFQLYNQKSSI